MIRLWDVHTCGRGWLEIGPTDMEQFLYDLLLQRPPEVNISHLKMPHMDAHCQFVRSKPYLHWYAISADNTQPNTTMLPIPYPFVGAIYLTYKREVGVTILKKHQGGGFATEAVKMVMEMHPGKFLANISPRNPQSIKFFKQFGIKHIQNTYVIGS